RHQIGTNPATTELLARFTYNSQHLPITATDASGQTNFFGYNTYGQITSITNPLNQSVTFTYNQNGYLTNISGALPDAPITITYDSYGRVRTLANSDNYKLTYDYDGLNRLTRVTYPDTTFEQFVYDKLDAAFSKDRRGHWTRSIYDARGQLTAVC